MWICYKYKPDNKVRKWMEVGRIDLPPDCFGDALYAYMIGAKLIDSMDNYNTYGDDSVVFVNEINGETKFRWDYIEDE